jgi:hypothetical protein
MGMRRLRPIVIEPISLRMFEWSGGESLCDSWWRQVMAMMPLSGAVSLSRAV